MVRLNGKQHPELYLASLLTVEAAAQGHICLPLDSLLSSTGRYLSDLAPGTADRETLRMALLDTTVVGRPGDYTPLILDEASRLYIHRYWQYEQHVADRLRALATFNNGLLATISRELCHDLVNKLFPEAFGDNTDSTHPAIAAFIALTYNLCLISGSPGTGKTTAVARILALLLELSTQCELRIALTAPTAKAAARLQESVVKAKRTLPCSDSLKQQIPEQAMTLHRLLGSRGDGSIYTYGEDRPLPFDVVVVDEASMIDLPLMAHLLDAIGEKGKLILLGDPNQLSSVAAGAVFCDICSVGALNHYSRPFGEICHNYTGLAPDTAGKQSTGIQDCLVSFSRNYRFPEESPLGHFRSSVLTGNSTEALSILNAVSDVLEWVEIEDFGMVAPMLEKRLGPLLRTYLDQIENYFRHDHTRPFPLDRFRVLCAHRHGLLGTIRVNELMERMCRRFINVHPDSMAYPGKLVMVTRNDYTQQLFNGDMGVFLPDKTGGDLYSVHFRDAQGLRKFSPFAIPEHEIAFTTTVHKSQGSEYEKVFLLLPETDSPILCRELIYTGITRARQSLTVVGSRDVLAAAIERKIMRHSGLTDKLR
jgi:exodeoxyribonuclease V alpha subunit